MNHLMNTIFGRMFLFHPNHFINYGIKNNQNNYFEHFIFSKDIYGTFIFKKTNTTIDNWKVSSDIAIIDESKKIQYIEKYNFDKTSNSNFENHILAKMNLTQNKCNMIEFIKFNNIPNNIQQLIYSKNDNDIIKCSCCNNSNGHKIIFL